MGHSYTPGLKVTQNEQLLKRRILPMKGEVVVEVGERVQPDDVVARTFLPGAVKIINIANMLGIDQSDVPLKMTVKEGDKVEKGQVIAESKSFFGLFKSDAKAPESGTIESISGVTGQVIMRGPPQPVVVRAYVEGDVVEVVPEEGVVVKTCGSFIQGIFGIGGESSGEVVMACDTPSDVLDADRVKPEHEGKILVGGSLVTDAALKQAIKVGAKGVVVGGFDAEDLRRFLGYDLGVAITGHEDLGITLVVTEGFGQIAMAPNTFALLKKHQGDRASINGATQIRAGVIRPEMVIPVKGTVHVEDKAVNVGIHVGSPIRMIRDPYFGLLGTVADLPSDPQVLESGSRARVAVAKLDNGETVIVPRANIELIEGAPE